jgi:hypothetical protein
MVGRFPGCRDSGRSRCVPNRCGEGADDNEMSPLDAPRAARWPDDLVFEDEGVSDTVLRRPGLERLRDLSVDGRFEVLLCHAPDGLARRYSYQVLLLEELERAGAPQTRGRDPSAARRSRRRVARR